MKRKMKMKEGILTLLALIFIALSITGFTYAQWSDVVVVSNKMTLGYWTQTIRFVHPLECSDNEVTKDVGQFDCYYTEADPVEGYKKLVIELSKAYPSYAVNCSFTLKEISSVASKILGVNISDPTGELDWMWTIEHTEGFLWKDFDGDGGYDLGEEIVYINLTELPGVVLDPYETVAAWMEVHIADNAEECHTYGLEVKILYD